jgi:hypothetical protein
VPYEHPDHKDVKLPKRQKRPESYREMSLKGHLIPTPY